MIDGPSSLPEIAGAAAPIINHHPVLWFSRLASHDWTVNIDGSHQSEKTKSTGSKNQKDWLAHQIF
jgi:hypothetical protein